jgi:hypothetical protein
LRQIGIDLPEVARIGDNGGEFFECVKLIHEVEMNSVSLGV